PAPGRCVFPREKGEKIKPARPARATPGRRGLGRPIPPNNWSRLPAVPEKFPERHFPLPEISVPPRPGTACPAKEAAQPQSVKGSPEGLAGGGSRETAAGGR